jgi:hypothetical protein
MASDIECEFVYRPRWFWIIIGVLLFGAGTIIFCHKALTNDRGLIINGIIELPITGATIFYWVMCVASAAFVFAANFLVLHRLAFSQRITFTSETIVVPRSRWSSEEIAVEYGAITGIEATEVSGEKFLRVTHSEGKFTIVASMLPTRQAYDEVYQLLLEHVRRAGEDQDRTGPCAS